MSKLSNFKNILIIFPHPDDEVATVSGLCALCKSKNIQTNLLILTKGEAGNNPKNRPKEMEESAKAIKTKLIQLDLGDGKLKNNKIILTKTIQKYIQKIKPDLLITYDQSGLYGHPDHIITSQVVTSLAKQHNLKLWYATLPSFVLDKIKLPTHMAESLQFKNNQTKPNIYLFIGRHLEAKLSSLHAHKSQYPEFQKTLPPWLSPTVAYGFQLWECFCKVE